MEASLWAMAMDAAMQSSATSQINPHSLARAAGNLSPVMASAMARAKPKRSTKNQLLPASGIKPILLKACMKLAPGAAMAISQVITKEAPAPAATPLTAAIVGMRNCCKRRVVGLKACSITGPGSARSTRSGPSAKSNSDKSAPAQKPRPAPVITKARILASASAWSSAAHKSWCIFRVKLLRACGRFNVTMATAPWT